MVAFLYLVALVSTVAASPLPHFHHIKFPPSFPRGLTCNLPFFGKSLCPSLGIAKPSIPTSIGSAAGVQSNGATRFAVKYASANRWESPTMQTVWELPNGSSDSSALPLACPQFDMDDSAMSEDCLSMLLYVPDTLRVGGSAPTLLWIHGGSYVVGSASGPGLDGSKLAVATDSIVAVVQYRLGGLGFMGPNGQSNFGVQDVIVAMKFLQRVLPAFGGSAQKITIAGQSSGADMVRALLAVDSASSLFRSAILQSDPMNFGFLSPGAHQTLQNYFNQEIGCSSSDSACLSALSVDKILDVSYNLTQVAVSLDPSAGTAQPIRPVHDGTLIVHTMDSTAQFPQVSKPLLLSTVKNEAGSSIYGYFDTPVAMDEYQDTVGSTFGSPRSEAVLKANFYKVNVLADGTTDARSQLEKMGTDYMWKCSTWTFAKTWVANGGSAYVGLYTTGASYPGNSNVPFCTQNGVVCHQDDIEIVFGTVSNPSSAQSSLTKQMQSRYKAFLSSGNPNTNGIGKWPAATKDSANAILLGSDGNAPVDACVGSFWGSSVLYDYQVYGI